MTGQPARGRPRESSNATITDPVGVGIETNTSPSLPIAGASRTWIATSRADALTGSEPAASGGPGDGDAVEVAGDAVRPGAPLAKAEGARLGSAEASGEVGEADGLAQPAARTAQSAATTTVLSIARPPATTL